MLDLGFEVYDAFLLGLDLGFALAVSFVELAVGCGEVGAEFGEALSHLVDFGLRVLDLHLLLLHDEFELLVVRHLLASVNHLLLVLLELQLQLLDGQSGFVQLHL